MNQPMPSPIESRAHRSPPVGGSRPVSGVVLALAVVAAAAFGAMFGPGSWYAELAKPTWTPPNAVFGPVWSVLYAMIFWAGWRVSRRAVGTEGAAAEARGLMRLWWAQLVANALWSAAFFGLQSPTLALAVIAVLLALIVAFAWKARRIDGLAAGLFVPYIAWVAFASALNVAIVALNA